MADDDENDLLEEMGGESEAVKAEDKAEAEVVVAPKAPAPKKKAAPRKPARPKNTTRIILEENDDIPPTGLFVSLNGRAYLIKPGEEVDLPNPVLEILENAVMSTPRVDPQTQQVIGYKNRMRYPFRYVG